MTLDDSMTGYGTEITKLINLPLPKGICDDLTPEGFIAFTTVDALFNARTQRLHADLSERNIDSVVIVRMIKSLTTFVPSVRQELVLVDELHRIFTSPYKFLRRCIVCAMLRTGHPE